MRNESSPGLAAVVLVVGLVAGLGCGSLGAREAPQPRAAAATAPAGETPRIASPRRVGPRIRALDSEHPDEPRWLGDAQPVEEGAFRFRRFSARNLALTAPPVRYGLMHAHTLFSDGSSTPAEAFARARARGLDFIGITEHNHAQAENGASGPQRDGVLIATTPALYDGADPVTVTRRFREDDQQRTETITVASLIEAARAASSGDFVPIFGQEFSSISSGNHLNVLGAEHVITIANGDFRSLYESLEALRAAGQRAPVLQMNHPNVHDDLFYGGSDPDAIRNMSNDYGFDDYAEDFTALVTAADPFVDLIEVLTGPAFAQTPRDPFHYGSDRMRERDYYYYLVQGWHLSPSVGHDNHFVTFGDATPARMGVLSDELTENALLDAMAANRTFASEDRDLELVLFGNGEPMGANLSVAAGAPIALAARVRDATDANTEYEVDLLYGDVHAQGSGRLVEWQPADGLQSSVSFQGDGEIEFEGFVASGAPEFFYVRVQQADGDRAWSAPVWVNHPRP